MKTRLPIGLFFRQALHLWSVGTGWSARKKNAANFPKTVFKPDEVLPGTSLNFPSREAERPRSSTGRSGDIGRILGSFDA
ncbi:hypothetical protein [Rhodovulum sp. BSW8]|uniref:hypothetical protein n=1 Tax=Rhodovulum sp. BSW8 TaxID=2259645 RepID=UPI001058A7AA|nr:hypothetical protein [Rhodovulum sp. BSW8]